jgi:hypothetical protein
VWSFAIEQLPLAGEASAMARREAFVEADHVCDKIRRLLFPAGHDGPRIYFPARAVSGGLCIATARDARKLGVFVSPFPRL